MTVNTVCRPEHLETGSQSRRRVMRLLLRKRPRRRRRRRRRPKENHPPAQRVTGPLGPLPHPTILPADDIFAVRRRVKKTQHGNNKALRCIIRVYVCARFKLNRKIAREMSKSIKSNLYNTFLIDLSGNYWKIKGIRQNKSYFIKKKKGILFLFTSLTAQFKECAYLREQVKFLVEHKSHGVQSEKKYCLF